MMTMREKNIISCSRLECILFVKLKSPLPKDALCQLCLIEISQVFWRRRFLNLVNVILAISLFSPF